MDNDKDENHVIFDLGANYNPYEDSKLVQAKSEPPNVDTREPFNDVIRHQDIVVGHRRNRTLSDYPPALRPWVRITAFCTLALFIASIIWDYVH